MGWICTSLPSSASLINLKMSLSSAAVIEWEPRLCIKRSNCWILRIFNFLWYSSEVIATVSNPFWQQSALLKFHSENVRFKLIFDDKLIEKKSSNLWREDEQSWLIADAVPACNSWSSMSGSQTIKWAIGSTLRMTCSLFSRLRLLAITIRVLMISFVGCPKDFRASNNFW